MFCVRQLTYCSKDWDAQPFRLYLIEDLNISSPSNICPKPGLRDESWLYNFKDVYPIYQTLQVQPVIGKCKVVEDLIFHVNKFSNKSWGVTHRLELKEHRAVQSSEAPQLTDSNKYHSNSAFQIQDSIHTAGPVLMVIHE